jgi:hypothetical protein
MGTKITVTTRPGNRISINNRQVSQVKSVNVVGATTAGAGIDTLEELQDVTAAGKANNYTLVYDATSAKYTIKELPIVNGGTF